MNIFHIRSSYGHKRGFTIVELVVVLGIFAGLAGVVLFRFNDFSSNISLQNLAQDIAVQIKKAQTQGSLGQSPDKFSAPNKPSFGVSFDIAAQDTFRYFADSNNDKRLFQAGCSSFECLDEIIINTTDRINRICINNCSSNADDINELYITYTRPDLTATFERELGPPSINIPTTTSVTIEVISVKGITKKIIVGQIGQIRVE